MVYNTYTTKDALVNWLTFIQDEKVEIHFGYERKEDGYEGII